MWIFKLYLGIDATGSSTHPPSEVEEVRSRSHIEIEASAPAESILKPPAISVLRLYFYITGGAILS